jgi:hypothetical protein
MNYEEEKGGLVLQLSSDNIFQLEKVDDILNSQDLRQQYQDIEKTALNRSETGNYKLSLKLGLKKINIE